jgi:hypothetical protein
MTDNRRRELLGMTHLGRQIVQSEKPKRSI